MVFFFLSNDELMHLFLQGGQGDRQMKSKIHSKSDFFATTTTGQKWLLQTETSQQRLTGLGNGKLRVKK